MRQHPTGHRTRRRYLQAQPRLPLCAQSAASLGKPSPLVKACFVTKPIVPWMGGKRRLASRLIPLFPPHECYVEVFAGGAALYFLRPEPAKTEVLNDLNGELVNLYRVVQHHIEELVRQFKWALSSRQIFEWQKMTRPETLTDIQRAARFFFLQHHAFGGKVTAQSFGTATTGPAINLLRIEENLFAAWQRLSGTYVENLPWLDCAEHYDRPHTFQYMDPPYWDRWVRS